MSEIFDRILRETKYGKIDTSWLENAFDEFESKYVYDDEKSANFGIFIKTIKKYWPYKDIKVNLTPEALTSKDYGSFKKGLLGPSINLKVCLKLINALQRDKDLFVMHKKMSGKARKNKDDRAAWEAKLDSLKDSLPKENWEMQKRRFTTTFEHEYTHYKQFKMNTKWDGAELARDELANKLKADGNNMRGIMKNAGDYIRQETSYFNREDELEAWAIDTVQELLLEYDLDEIVDMTKDTKKLFRAIKDAEIGDIDDTVSDLLPTLMKLEKERPIKFNIFIGHMIDYIEDNFEM